MLHKYALSAVLAGFATLASALPAQAQKTVTIVPHSNLTILDPIWTTAYMSRNHGYMIYDTLFGTDDESRVQPQMVEGWKVSDDQKVWDFKLRAGLEFHDGAPVTSEDVIASLARWSKRDPMGGALMTFVEKMEAMGKDSFRMTLKQPNGFMLEALAKPSSVAPFIMPKRIAETPPNTQITEHVGSGPYIFVKEEFKPGDKAVYVKNPKYVPRKEPASGTAGGKKVYVDKVVWNLALRDYQSQVNALVKGEIDIIEFLPFDHYRSMLEEKSVRVIKPKIGLQFACRFNHLHPPFDKAEVRRAAAAAFVQEPFMSAQVGVKELYASCPSMFTCGTPYASTVGTEIQSKSNMKQAQDLVKKSGYDGTPVVVMRPTDNPAIDKLPMVAAQLMRQAGFKVDLQVMDWQTLVSRRAKKEPPKDGGWNMFCTAFGAADIWNPISNPFLTARGAETGFFGWPKDAKLEELRNQFMVETDAAKKKALAERIQAQAFVNATHVPLGEYWQPVAIRTNLKGLIPPSLANVYWNIDKD